MLENKLLLVLSLLLAVTMLAILSNRLKISYPIFLVITGLAISFIPRVPDITLEPDFVFFIFLPPLLYASAWNTSWNDFWKYKRPIGLLSVGCVIFTAGIVAVAAHWLIPGFSLALGFLLGGIISPPDAVAATSVLKELRLPKRVSVILEGESLVNDASSLIVFRFALAAILTGEFVLWNASLEFVKVALAGIIIGLAVAHVFYFIHRFLTTTPAIDTALSLMAPYLMYLAADHFHYSGVLSVVSGGLFLSFRSQDIYSYSSRLQMLGVWHSLVFILNGMVFILIGLQLPQIIDGLGEYQLKDAIAYAAFISLVAIIVRIVWVYPSAYIPRLLSRAIRKREPRPPPKTIFLIGWSGMRGVVSLATALAVPFTVSNGQSFPHRDLILFISFTVILFTLVLQGLSLPWIVRLLNIQVDEGPNSMEYVVRLRLANASLEYLQKNYAKETETLDAFTRVKQKYERMIDNDNRKLNGDEPGPGFSLKDYRKMLLELNQVRRKEVTAMRLSRQYDEELLREREEELDLEEARLRK